MEQNLRGKKFTWPTVCEYFTKRGRPLTNDEIRQLRQEDELMEQQRQYEADQLEAETRLKMEKLNEVLEQEEDFEAYQARMM